MTGKPLHTLNFTATARWIDLHPQISGADIRRLATATLTERIKMVLDILPAGEPAPKFAISALHAEKLVADGKSAFGAMDFAGQGADPQPAAQTGPVLLTLVESTTGSAAKTFSLSRDGRLNKRSGGQIYEGRARIVEVNSLEEFIALKQLLKTDQALVYGIPEVKEARLVTKKVLQALDEPCVIARDSDHFSYAEDRPGS